MSLNNDDINVLNVWARGITVKSSQNIVRPPLTVSSIGWQQGQTSFSRFYPFEIVVSINPILPGGGVFGTTLEVFCP